jgi:hypothetical protein
MPTPGPRRPLAEQLAELDRRIAALQAANPSDPLIAQLKARRADKEARFGGTTMSQQLRRERVRRLMPVAAILEPLGFVDARAAERFRAAVERDPQVARWLATILERQRAGPD